jgi:hypothetical protein
MPVKEAIAAPYVSPPENRAGNSRGTNLQASTNNHPKAPLDAPAASGSTQRHEPTRLEIFAEPTGQVVDPRCCIVTKRATNWMLW